MQFSKEKVLIALIKYEDEENGANVGSFAFVASRKLPRTQEVIVEIVSLYIESNFRPRNHVMAKTCCQFHSLLPGPALCHSSASALFHLTSV